MRRSLKGVVLACALLQGAACRGGGGEEDAQQATLSDFGAAIVTAECEKIFECCSPSDFGFIFGEAAVEDMQDCEEIVGNRTRVFLVPALEQSVQEGRVHFEPSKIDGCVQALQKRSCEAFSPETDFDVLGHAACQAVVEPQLQGSNFCTNDFECTSGFCSRASGAAEGSCKDVPMVGDPCLNGRCGEGSFCDEDEICRETLSEGQSCTRDFECASGSCVQDEDQSFVCASVNEVCES